jgi:type II secretory pathway pseudopilin PulG
MKYLISLLVLCACSGCATHRTAHDHKSVIAVSGATVSRKTVPEVQTPEVVKAYPVGRYTDPNFPDEMHERHTLYRIEQPANWDYQSNVPYALPLGPTVALSNPSPSYYVKTDDEQMSSQQKAYAEALEEQNRAMKRRIDEMQREAAKVPQIEQQIDQLKQKVNSGPLPEPTPKGGSKPAPEPVSGFSKAELPLPDKGEGISDPCEILLFADSPDQSQAFLISQMRLNDEFDAELSAWDQRKPNLFVHREDVALLSH